MPITIKKTIQIKAVNGYLYQLIFTKSDRYKPRLSYLNGRYRFIVSLVGKELFFKGRVWDSRIIDTKLSEIPEISFLEDDCRKLFKSQIHKNDKESLYEVLNCLLESFGFPPPKIESIIKLSSQPYDWIRYANGYFKSAQILERNYYKIFNKGYVDWGNKRHVEADSSYLTILFLYAMSLECIVKSKVYDIYLHVDTLYKRKNIAHRRFVLRKWLHENIYIHNITLLAKFCGYYRASDKIYMERFSSILASGKYPVPRRRDVLNDYNANSKKRKSKSGQLVHGKQAIKIFKDYVLKIIKRMYGQDSKEYFIQQRLTGFKFFLTKAKQLKEGKAILMNLKLY